MITSYARPCIISLETIKSVLPGIDLFNAISNGFIEYSKGNAVIPPVGELLFDSPPGEVHIKYGYINSFPYWVVKIASGFSDNPSLGLPSGNGLNLLFSKTNGNLSAILLDEGYLTSLRTAVAGALATRALCSCKESKVGIVGTGTQGRMQLEYLRKIIEVDEIYLWNRNISHASLLADELKVEGIRATVTPDLEDLCRKCRIIITTTPATEFLIKDSWIHPGTHITAIGSDTAEKNELEPSLLDRADVVVTDSISQSQFRGEVFMATKAGLMKTRQPLELGALLNGECQGRINDRQITIADLTGVAVQDLMISYSVYEQVKSLKNKCNDY